MVDNFRLKQPVAQDGAGVHFNDGTTIEVFRLAREWASMYHNLHGGACMVPDCSQHATSNIALWGRHVGRVCDKHFELTAEILERGRFPSGE